MKTRIPICWLSALCSQTLLNPLSAQNVVFTARNGGNLAYCGPLGGPSEWNRFSLPEPTHDVIAVSDPGTTNWSASSASSQLVATPSSAGFLASASGRAERGALLGFGVYAVADARDDWEFTLAAPARFNFNATLKTSSSQPAGVVGAFVFGAHAFNQIVPDPGTPPGAFGGALPNTGTLAVQAKGRLMPGRYSISFNCRVDGNNTYPFSGSFDYALSLELGPDVPAIFRTQIVPQGLEIEWTDLGPKQYTVETASSLLGAPWTPVSEVVWPISARTIVLPPPATVPAFYRVKME